MNNKYNLENVRNIIFYDNRTGAAVLTINTNNTTKILFDSESMMGASIKTWGSLQTVILKNPVLENKRKENFKIKENYILHNKDAYFKTTNLYININIENIIIEEEEEKTTKKTREENEITKNYIIKNFNCIIKNKKHVFFTNEEVDTMEYKRWHFLRLEKIDELIKDVEEKKFLFSEDQKKELKDFYINKQKAGFTYRGYDAIEEEKNIFYYNLFLRLEKTKEGNQAQKNRDFIKKYCNIDYINHDIIKVLDLLNIDLCIIDLEKIAAKKGDQ